MKDSVKSPDYTERLAHKYMWKCTVESSTEESESESSVEVTPKSLSGGLKNARGSGHLQFLDPYDGDSEDESIHSDCSLNTVNRTKVAPQANSVPKAMALEDAYAVNDCKVSLEPPSQQKDFPRSQLQSSELLRATEAFTSMWPRHDPSLFVSINPSSSADLLASPGNSALQPILTGDCNGTMAKQPLIKRKQGIPIPESASKKLKGKKFCAT
ncbi:uncharacterized protein LOC135190246 isoform X2 [Pogoniulus pusillus]